MIGVKIKYLRLQRGYSITRLAKKAKISKSYLSYLEKNPETNPSLHIISKIAEALETSPNYFIEGAAMEERRDDVNQEWIDLLLDGLDKGMTQEDFMEFQKYMEFLTYRKSR